MANDELYFITKNTLKEIADSIRAKKSITNALKPSNFAEEILSIESGSSAKIIKEAPVEQWTGTTIPREGTLETLYINYKYPVDKMLEIFDQIPDEAYTTPFEGFSMYAVCGTADASSFVAILKNTSSSGTKYFIYACDPIYTSGNSELIFGYDATNNYYKWAEYAMIFYEQGLAGNFTLAPEVTVDNITLFAGTQNELLKNIFSLTPVYYTSDWIGTAIPNSGFCEKVYINFDLTEEQVVGLLCNPNINYTQKIVSGSDAPLKMNIALASESGSVILGCMLYPTSSGYAIIIMAIIGGSELPLFVSGSPEMINELGFSGWNPEFKNLYEETGYYELNETLLQQITDGESVILAGLSNVLLSSLFSTAPFIKGESEEILLSGDYDGNAVEVNNKNINLREFIANKAIPLDINVNLPTVSLVATKVGVYNDPTLVTGQFKNSYTEEDLTNIYAANGNNTAIVGDTNAEGLDALYSGMIILSNGDPVITILDLSNSANTGYPIMGYNLTESSSIPFAGWFGQDTNGNHAPIAPPKFSYRADLVQATDAALNLLLDNFEKIQCAGFNPVQSLYKHTYISHPVDIKEKDLSGRYSGAYYHMNLPSSDDDNYENRFDDEPNFVIDMEPLIDEKNIPWEIHTAYVSSYHSIDSNSNQGFYYSRTQDPFLYGKDIGELWINTELAKEDVLSILKQITVKDNSDPYYFYHTGEDYISCFKDAALGYVIECKATGENAYILFSEKNGWTIRNFLKKSFNGKQLVEYNNTIIGYKNNAAKELFAQSYMGTIPFTEKNVAQLYIPGTSNDYGANGYDGKTAKITRNGVFELKKYLLENKLPINFSVDVPVAAMSELQITKNGTYSFPYRIMGGEYRYRYEDFMLSYLLDFVDKTGTERTDTLIAENQAGDKIIFKSTGSVFDAIELEYNNKKYIYVSSLELFQEINQLDMMRNYWYTFDTDNNVWVLVSTTEGPNIEFDYLSTDFLIEESKIKELLKYLLNSYDIQTDNIPKCYPLIAPSSIEVNIPVDSVAEEAYNEGYEACEQETIDLLDDI